MTKMWCSDCYESTEIKTINGNKNVSFTCGNCGVINYRSITSK